MDLNPDDGIPGEKTAGLGELGAVWGRGRFRRAVWGRVDGIFEAGAGGMTVGRTGGSRTVGEAGNAVCGAAVAVSIGTVHIG